MSGKPLISSLFGSFSVTSCISLTANEDGYNHNYCCYYNYYNYYNYHNYHNYHNYQHDNL